MNKKFWVFFIIVLLTPILLYSIGNHISPVKNFNLTRYLGKWFEIARYDHYFERNLEEVTAEYSIRKDGKVKVVNKGFHTKKNKIKTAEGYAIFSGPENIGELKVTFFWPFFGTYRIALLDKDYKYALVIGDDFNYVWILSRTPILEKKIIDQMLEFLKTNGFNTEKLLWVKHTI